MAAITSHASLAVLLSSPSSARPGVRASIKVELSKLASSSRAKSTHVTKVAAVDFPSEEMDVPTPDVPSTRMMADFLTTYGRALNHLSSSGDVVATAGFFVLERVRVGVMSLLENTVKSAEWEAKEKELELCLTELQKDLNLIQRYHAQEPNRLVIQMASLRCIQAARLLQRL